MAIHDVTTSEHGAKKGGANYWARCSCGWESPLQPQRWDAICRMVDAHKAEAEERG